MGQEWIIVNLDRREYRYIGKFGEDWFDDEEKSLTRVLSRPLVKAKLEFNPRHFPKGRKSCKAGGSLGLFGKLPLEMCHAIFSETDDIVDVAALSITHRSLLSLGLDRIRDLNYEEIQDDSWAGDRIICISTDVWDPPEHALTEVEIDEFSKGGSPDCPPFVQQILAEWDDDPDDPEDSRLDAHLSRSFTGVDHRVGMYAHGYQRYQSHLWQRLLTWSKMYQTTVEEDIALDEIRFQSTKGWALPQAVWVACNLDKKQFVHEDAVRSLNDKEEGPFRARERHLRCIPDFTLGFIVGVLVCWSVEDDSVQRGPWAGNRVALMPIEEMKGEWEDISANALERTLEFPPLNT